MDVSSHSIGAADESIQLEPSRFAAFVHQYVATLTQTEDDVEREEPEPVPVPEPKPDHDLNHDTYKAFVNNYNEDTLYVVVPYGSGDFHVYGELSNNSNANEWKSSQAVLVLAFIKSKGRLINGIPLSHQLNIINISSDTSRNAMFDKLRSVVNLGLTPYFDLVIGTEDSDKFTRTKRKFNELSLSLQNIQRQIQIPDLTQSIHPQIYELLANDDSEVTVDSGLLNELTTIVNNWTKQIQMVTNLNHEPSDDEFIVDEKAFWESMESALISIVNQISNTPAITKTIEILNSNKRFQITISFQKDTGINDKLSTAKLYNSLLKELPIEDVISSSHDLSKFESVIVDLFNYLKGKVRNLNGSFALSRLIEYIELILNDITHKLMTIIIEINVLSIELSKYLDTYTQTNSIISVIDHNLKYLINLIRELLRKRQDKFMMIKLESISYTMFKERFESLKAFRLNHSNLLSLLSVIQPHLQTQLVDTYSRYIIPAKPFDLSKQGQLIWSINEKNYLTIYHDLYTQISLHINAYFSHCICFHDFLTVIDKFGHEICTLINDEYKLKLLGIVNDEVEQLMLLNLHSKSYYISTFQDLYSKRSVVSPSPLVGEIMWNLSLLTKFHFYLHKLERVLGSNWNQYSLGTKIHANITNLLEKSTINSLMDLWISGASTTLDPFPAVNSPVIQMIEEDIHINIDMRVLELCVDYTYLSQTKSSTYFKIPVDLQMTFKKVMKLYPFMIDVSQTITSIKSIFNQDIITQWGFMLDHHKQAIGIAVKDMLKVQWHDIVQALELSSIDYEIDFDFDFDFDNDNLSEIRSLRSLSRFQNVVKEAVVAVEELNQFVEFLQTQVYNLKVCSYTSKAIEEILVAVQQKVNQVSLNISEQQVDRLCQLINDQVQGVLTEKCLDRLEDPLVSQPIHHDLVFSDQSFTLSPSLSVTKTHMFELVNELIAIIEGQPQIYADYETKQTFSINIQLHQPLSTTYGLIDSVIDEAQSYLEQWHSLQRIWELDLNVDEDLQQALPSDLSFPQLITHLDTILRIRSLFDNPDSTVIFQNLMAINSIGVQSRVTLKFDTFQGELISKFASRYSQEFNQFSRELTDSINRLEAKLNVAAAVAELITNINNYLTIKQDMDRYNDTLTSFKAGQTFLFKHRFRFASDWIYTEQLDNDMAIIRSLLTAKEKTLEDNFDILAPKIQSEAVRINASVVSLVSDWELKKPIAGHLVPSLAIVEINNFQHLCGILAKNSDAVANISRSLNIATIPPQSLESISHEITDLRSVWIALNALWEDLDQIKSTVWKQMDVGQVQRQLDDLLNNARSLPGRVRQYASFDEIHNVIKQYLNTFVTVQELQSSSMKPRHWTSLLGQLNKIQLDPDRLTLGDVWGFNLNLNRAIVKAVLDQASEEEIIESKLESITKEWNDIHLEWFHYDNKVKLVRHWDRVFEQANSDISSLASMKNSAYYSSFEAEITRLEDKLIGLLVVWEKWMEVQRQWLYLDGVFGNDKADIASLLPIESNRFVNFTYEFFNVLKRIHKHSLVMDVVGLKDMESTFSNFLHSLTKLRKSLADYLEKQRELFPRFYFIGNEDLLDLIGGSADMARINRHVAKMFTGVAQLKVDEDSSSVVGVYSPQHEYLELNRPVSVKLKTLHEWLSELDTEIKHSLALLVKDAITEVQTVYEAVSTEALEQLMVRYPAQVVTVAAQVVFSKYLSTHKYQHHHTLFTNIISHLTTLMTRDSTAELLRHQVEYILIELLHHRDIFSRLMACKTPEDVRFITGTQQLFHHHTSSDVTKSITITQAGASFTYGFEYLGIPEKLAYTPLVEKCYLTMTQALNQKLGGSPYGPAGTGKTESIKALGHNLGKMVIVFCCDETFDFTAMGRLLLGLCGIGCWGCFDEFNRLDEGVLSSISSQIKAVETGLGSNGQSVSISGKSITVHSEVGLFVTMNPGYEGRSELPENLKKQFRTIAMNEPDREVIVEVLLTAQTFAHAASIAKVLVPFFLQLQQLTTDQQHYDFGLRSIKTALVRCGALKRILGQINSSEHEEHRLVLQSINETIAPKLVEQDMPIFHELQNKYFKNIHYDESESMAFLTRVDQYYTSHGLVYDNKWKAKTLQLYQIQQAHHGIMLVGQSGSGKSVTWRSVLDSVAQYEHMDYLSYVIDSKVLTKDQLYGWLDPVTREWTDGLFTQILRKIIDNLKGELSKMVWIVFDGDVDPEWAENLNSVLDDNRVLTLSNGERLGLPANVRILFEVDSIRHATLATVSRCGIVYFEPTLVSVAGIVSKFLFDLEHIAIDGDAVADGDETLVVEVQTEFANGLHSILSPELVSNLVEAAQKLNHIMNFTVHRAVESLTSLLKSYCRRLVRYTEQHESLTSQQKSVYLHRAVLVSVNWALAGDCSSDDRRVLSEVTNSMACFNDYRLTKGTYFDVDIQLPDGDWILWNSQVAVVDLEPHHVINPSTIIPTDDTVKHESLIYSIINEHRSLLLCGPPGSGKTMSLLEALRKSPQLDLLSLNFSKDMTPKALLQSLEQACTYRQTSTGPVLCPKLTGKWLVVFCDEINLPAKDKYDTQAVISFIRQLMEQQGFWRCNDNQWITLENIQFVGACNSPQDPGRNVLSDRFLRHSTLLMVDYPGSTSLYQIYHTFTRAILKFAPNLRGYAGAITEAMIEVYTQSKKTLTCQLHSHYIYSPRELTRWTRGMLEGLKQRSYDDVNDLVYLWYHEGLRLFYDRLVGTWERSWTMKLFEEVSTNHFPSFDHTNNHHTPVLFSHWLTGIYEPVDESELRTFVVDKLHIFKEEVCEVELVLHQDLLDHCLRIDRVLRQPQGHMILVGPSSSGKSTLTRFMAWMNGLEYISLNVHRQYSLQDFDSTLRRILLKCAQGDRICFMIDESNILETAFVERMNTLLANAEIPGLYEGEEYDTLMNVCVEQSHQQGLSLDSKDELYSWFVSQISRNLHVVFNVSDTSDGFSPAIISSPALFNRCVLSWMGDWSNETLITVGTKLIAEVPLDVAEYTVPVSFVPFVDGQESTFRDVLVDTLVYMHRLHLDYQVSVHIHQSPHDFMEMVSQFIRLFDHKSHTLEESQGHTTCGLDKLKETVLVVNNLKAALSEKKAFLVAKDKQAKIVLNKMLTEQNEAERKHEFSIVTQEELAKQELEIQKRKTVVMGDLERAEPAVLEAQRGVQNIKKQHLTEIRSMSSPPDAVKLTMESVCVLLGYQVSSWRDVLLVIRREDFIPNIVNFNCERHMTDQLRAHMNKTYLNRKDYTYEASYRASKACGPLLQWVVAQLAYSEILVKVGPLREEVEQLEAQTKQTKVQLIAIEQMIQELQAGIEKYKEDYSTLIRESENIKQEMRIVEKKIERSLKLVGSLTGERERWKSSIQKFVEIRHRLVGDSVLAAAFVVYAGVYDEKGRQQLMKLWKLRLTDAGIVYDEGFSAWAFLGEDVSINNMNSLSVSTDETHQENMRILQSSGVPLIIDPTMKSLELVRLSHPKIIITSFLNADYLKQIENGLRFGGQVIVQDAEYYDPAIDSILKHEIQRSGSRMVIRLRDQLIDYSNKFKLYLHTKDSSIRVLPFVASRTTMVNFTVTSGSLENAVLNLTLQAIKPEIAQKRIDIMKLQGDYQSKLHSLEEDLLVSLNSAQGNLLDNGDVVDKLESIKEEAHEIDVKLSEAAKVVQLVETSRIEYAQLGTHAAYLYGLVERLVHLHKLYKFSLEDFMATFVNLLQSKGTSFEPNQFIEAVYREVFAAVSVSLKANDKMAFALGLMSTFYRLDIGETYEKTIVTIAQRVMGEVQEKVVELELELELDNAMDKVEPLISSLQCPNKGVGFIEGISTCATSLFSGHGPFSSYYDLKQWVGNNTNNKYPILFLSPEGYDASFKVQDLASELNKQLVIVSMGSKESHDLADVAITQAAKDGTWITIQNVQMSVEWLSRLEKKLDSMDKCHEDFMLFLTANFNSSIPAGLIAKCKILSFEIQPSFKSVLSETFNSYNIENESREFCHIYFLLCWFHSVVSIRLNYVPMSFKKQYDINDSDFRSALSVLQDISVKDIAWKNLSYLIGDIIYGGKIDIEEDCNYIRQCSQYLFSVESTNKSFNLIRHEHMSQTLQIPTGNYQQWIDSLPDQASLTWVDLEEEVDVLYRNKQGQNVAAKYLQLVNN
ncbi:dynein heavy chain, cytosolic [Scheffersomyces amazonensis]|uniref:dynein heavy chain, cytosolic n=1 Tax=Scheffersomyces amazonensis TaxID=1078765 RepID=UPI00315C9038